ncbi:MAG: prepilin-type N-terminal cleavage/methylation domain-containing protein [Thermoguttaceae bacterium]
MRSPCRGGFSLLEVIIAISILLGSAVVLAELASIGRHHVQSAEEMSTAQLECQTKLNELLAGAAPLEAVQNVPLGDDPVQLDNPMQLDDILQDAATQGDPLGDPPEWVYSVEIEPITGPNQPPGMAQLRVTVAQNLAEEEHPKQFTLTHWIRDANLSGMSDATSGRFSDPLSDELSELSTEMLDELLTEPAADLFDPSFDGGLR